MFNAQHKSEVDGGVSASLYLITTSKTFLPLSEFPTPLVLMRSGSVRYLRGWTTMLVRTRHNAQQCHVNLFENGISKACSVLFCSVLVLCCFHILKTQSVLFSHFENTQKSKKKHTHKTLQEAKYTIGSEINNAAYVFANCCLVCLCTRWMLHRKVTGIGACFCVSGFHQISLWSVFVTTNKQTCWSIRPLHPGGNF